MSEKDEGGRSGGWFTVVTLFVAVLVALPGSFHAQPSSIRQGCDIGLAMVLIVGMFASSTDGKPGLARFAMALYLIFWVSYRPWWHPYEGRYGANTRACYANQKTVVGAIEMYNLDKNTKRTTLDTGFWIALKSGGYLQSIPQDPGQGSGTSGHYRTTDTKFGMTCDVHGTLPEGKMSTPR